MIFLPVISAFVLTVAQEPAATAPDRAMLCYLREVDLKASKISVTGASDLTLKGKQRLLLALFSTGPDGQPASVSDMHDPTHLLSGAKLDRAANAGGEASYFLKSTPVGADDYSLIVKPPLDGKPAGEAMLFRGSTNKGKAPDKKFMASGICGVFVSSSAAAASFADWKKYPETK